jgi:hypothetical protein
MLLAENGNAALLLLIAALVLLFFGEETVPGTLCLACIYVSATVKGGPDFQGLLAMWTSMLCLIGAGIAVGPLIFAGH